MVTHAKLQYYRHNYGLVFITGLLGCRWHRYKQSTRDSRKRDLVAFTFCLLTFLFMVFFLYFILISENDFDSFNWYLYTKFHDWFPFYTVFLAVICVMFVYLVLIMILSLCHILHRHQLYIHPVHVFMCCVCVSFCIAATVLIDKLWHTQWSVVYLSLKVMGPFLQIGSVIFLTLLSWLIIGQIFTLSTWYLKTLWLCVFGAVMISLYISPLFINSPCVIAWSDLPPKPKILAHRGASGIAPENTMISFQTAVKYGVYGFETNVRISYDGVPFLMHDSTLRRTTNVAEVFPNKVSVDCSYLNISQLQQLDAGSWFLEEDPMMTAGKVTDEMKVHYRKQHIPTLQEVLKYASQTNRSIMFDIHHPPESHPFSNRVDQIIADAINESKISFENVLWLTGKVEKSLRDKGYTLVAREIAPSAELKKKGISMISVMYSDINFDTVRDYRAKNISTNLFIVNKAWFFSLYWCLGVSSVATDMCQVLQNMEQPVWHLAPRSYLIMWITVDVLSAVIMVVIFIIQRIQRQGSKYSPESVSLNSGNHGSHRNSNHRSDSYRRNKRLMKEKLLMRDVAADLFDVEPEMDEFGIESNYTVTSTDGRVLARTFRNENESHHGTFNTQQPLNSTVRYQDPDVQSDPIHNL